MPKGTSSSSKSPRENFMAMAAVGENGHKAKNDISGNKYYGLTRQEASKHSFMTKVDSRC
jgi:hypothetical protein